MGRQRYILPAVWTSKIALKHSWYVDHTVLLLLEHCYYYYIQECPSVVIDSEVKDNASNLAEELCVNGRLKKRVSGSI